MAGKSTKTKKSTVSKKPQVVERTEAVQQDNRSAKKWLNKKTLISASVLIVIGLLTWQYIAARQEVKKLSDSKNNSQLAKEEVIKKVSKIALVPSDETPVVASVSDISKFKSNPLFDQAQNGDKYLTYAKSGRTVIYRPSTNQIITTVTLKPEDSSKTTQ